MARFDARFKVIEELKEKNFWIKTSSHEMVLPLCSRTGDVIEPILK
jgi:valyl-tRNA synthetase